MKLFGRDVAALGTRTRGAPRTAPGCPIYAIGDVHGQLDLLRRLLEQIIAHATQITSKEAAYHIVFLGDVIDRGEDSAACLGIVKKLIDAGSATLLLGNHEDMLLASLGGNAEAQRAWGEHGGLACMESFGIPAPRQSEDAFDIARRLQDGIPQMYVDLLRNAPVSFVSGDYFLVHAGVRPGVSIERQERNDLISIREEFTTSSEWHGAMIVHGHSAVPNVEIRHNRIACDTLAYKTGRLSCVCLLDDLITSFST